MSLTVGQRLGPYEVISALGAGGMGEVYRARDPKLNRDVAIKVLLPTVANDPDRLARFSREAQVLASLNHPNTAHINQPCFRRLHNQSLPDGVEHNLGGVMQIELVHQVGAMRFDR